MEYFLHLTFIKADEHCKVLSGRVPSMMKLRYVEMSMLLLKHVLLLQIDKLFLVCYRLYRDGINVLIFIPCTFVINTSIIIISRPVIKLIV